MKHPLSRCAAFPVCTAPSLASREGAYGQPARPSQRGGAAGIGPCSVSLRWAVSGSQAADIS